MDEADCAATMAYGMEAIAGGADLLCIGEMGIGNTTIAAAVCHGLYGGEPAADWVGPGTGVDAEGLKRKAEAVGRGWHLHKAHLEDPLEVLRRLGGRELAAMAGAILAARTPAMPVLIDGYVAALPPPSCTPCVPTLSTIAWPRIARPSPPTAICWRLGKEPLLDLGMRLGEGSGAALARSDSSRRPPTSQRHGDLRQRRRQRQEAKADAQAVSAISRRWLSLAIADDGWR